MSLAVRGGGGDDLARWSASLALVLAAHGLLALGLVRWDRLIEGVPPAPPAVMVDLPAAPAPSVDLPAPQPPEPVRPEELIRKLELPPPLPPEPVRPEELIQEMELPPPDPAEPVSVAELLEKIELPEVPQVAAPEAVLPPPEPRRKPTPPRPAAAPKPPAPPPAPEAPVKAPQAAAPTPPAVAPPSPDLRIRFEALLLAHLERHMRYPRAARLRNQQGTAHLRLTMDRSGRVIEARVERGSGYAVLDREVIATLERAEPLPSIPAELGLERLEVIVPMSFKLRGGD